MKYTEREGKLTHQGRRREELGHGRGAGGGGDRGVVRWSSECSGGDQAAAEGYDGSPEERVATWGRMVCAMRGLRLLRSCRWLHEGGDLCRGGVGDGVGREGGWKRKLDN